ncbi:MAG: ATP-binding cassette domain-containing protein, partial [Anaeroplasma sp.]
MINIDKLSVVFNKNSNFKLNISSLSISKNNLVVIYGESGSGKSTFAKAISGKIKCEERNISINGNKLDNKELNDYFEYIPTNATFIKSFTVYDTLHSKGRLWYCEEDLKSRIDYLLDKVGLFSHKYDKVSSLSGGEKQKLSVICGLLSEKPILVFDEPNHSLDEENSKIIFDVIIEQKDKTIFVIAHNYSYIINSADKVIKFNRGNIEMVNDNFNQNGENIVLIKPKRKLFHFVEDIKSYSFKSILQFLAYLIIFTLEFVGITAICFITSIQNEGKYFIADTNKMVTGYDYNIYLYSKDYLLSQEDLSSILENVNYSEVLVDNYLRKSNLLPFNEDLDIIYGKTIENNDEVLLFVNPINYIFNSELYKSKVNTYEEYTVNWDYKNNKAITKKYKIVGIAEGKCYCYNDAGVFCSKDEYYSYENPSITNAYGICFSDFELRNVIINKDNVVINNNLSNNTVAYQDNNLSTKLKISKGGYYKEMMVNVVPGDDSIQINQEMYDFLFSESVLKCYISFPNERSKNMALKYLSSTNFTYEDVSYSVNNKIITISYICIILGVLLVAGILSFFILKSQNQSRSFFKRCGFTGSSVRNTYLVRSFILCGISLPIVFYVSNKLNEIKYLSQVNYYLFNWINPPFVITIFVSSMLLILLTAYLLEIILDKKESI